MNNAVLQNLPAISLNARRLSLHLEDPLSELSSFNSQHREATAICISMMIFEGDSFPWELTNKSLSISLKNL